MKDRVYKPNIGRISRDILIVGAMVYIVSLFNIGWSLKIILGDTLFIISFGLVYMFVVGYLPRLTITEEGEVKYRSDYGITHTIDMDKIREITKGSGLGGYRHALFLKYINRQGKNKTLKIKSSIFKQQDMIDFIESVRRKVQIETNRELDEYIK